MTRTVENTRRTTTVRRLAGRSKTFGVAVSGDGRSVYVTTAGDTDMGTVSQFDVGIGGVLTPKNPRTVAAGAGAAAVAVGPDLTPPLPTSVQQCKNGGWRNFDAFKNQGDCISFVRHQARQQCIFIRARHGRAAFRTFFGAGIHKRHAMRRCIQARSTG